MPERAFYFGRTAAEILGMPVRPRRDEVLHIAVRAGARRIDAMGVRSHHVSIREEDVIEHRGLPVTSFERSWCDIAALGGSLSELVAAGDALLQHARPVSTRASLEGAVARHGGRRGARVLRRALQLVTDRSDSAPESELRVAIIEAGLPMPRINEPIRDERGRPLATPDLSWPAQLVVVEYEGDHHRTDRAQWHRDLERFGLLQELGWRVLRASAADYRDPRPLLRRLTRLLA